MELGSLLCNLFVPHGLLTASHPKSSCRTHPDGLLAQPGAPRQLGTSLHCGVVRDLEQRLELLDLTVSEHRPHPELLKRLRGHRRGLQVSAVSRQRLHIWGGKDQKCF